jgi:hypothetical protein
MKFYENSCSNKILFTITFTYVTFSAMWRGIVLVLEVKYDSYCILYHCCHGTHERKYVPLECYKLIRDRTKLGASKILKKWILGSSWLSVHPSVRIEQLGSYWTNFVNVWYLRTFPKLWRKFINWLKSDKITGTLDKDKHVFISIFHWIRLIK